MEPPCPGCGYSYTALERAEIAPGLRSAAAAYGAILGTDVGQLREHRQSDIWSPLEYAGHVRDVYRTQESRVLQACAEDEPDFPSMLRQERVRELSYNTQEPAVVAAEIVASADSLAVVLEGLDEAAWERTGVYNWPVTLVRTVDWIGRHTVHESLHHFQDMDRLLRTGTTEDLITTEGG
jgi:S-DNA-T family DNA segregation ATPase FtsK/SpoIIIE